MNLIIESIVVGIIVVIIGSIVGYFLGKTMGINLPQVCKTWNKNHIMELSLFLTGVIVHLLCEYTQLNKWYCKNGNACKY